MLVSLVALSAAFSINAGHSLETQSTPLANPSQNITEEMQLITKSLDDLLGELTVIKQEANGRLSNVKNRISTSTSDPEQIRQVKVSRFVLRRVAELESESQSMREELNKLFNLRFKQNQRQTQSAQLKQEDSDFDDSPASSTTTTTTTQTESSGTTLKPSEQEEAAKIGFDVEALKKLGEEIGKRLDQFGKDAAKNLGELLEGVKFVFREPNSGKGGGSQQEQNRTASSPQ